MTTSADRGGGVDTNLHEWPRVLLVAMAFVLAGCDEGPAPVDHLRGLTMGTSYSIRLGETIAAGEAEALEERIAARLQDINNAMSTWDADSEISRFNASRAVDWIPVSPEFAAVAAAAVEVGEQSGGAFDPTVGPLVALWGFGPGRSREQATTVPTAADLADARKVTGYQFLEVRADPPALRKASLPALQLDLSGIAKGYAVDVIADLLESEGITSYLVEIGGEVRAGAAKPDGSPWRIGIEAPHADERTVHRVLELTDSALATSGDYRAFLVLDGRRHSHLIDPRTGRPVPDESLGSVSIVAPTCQFADAMATALYVLGPEEGPRLAESQKLNTVFLMRRDDEISEITTGSFDKNAGES